MLDTVLDFAQEKGYWTVLLKWGSLTASKLVEISVVELEWKSVFAGAAMMVAE